MLTVALQEGNKIEVSFQVPLAAEAYFHGASLGDAAPWIAWRSGTKGSVSRGCLLLEVAQSWLRKGHKECSTDPGD